MCVKIKTSKMIFGPYKQHIITNYLSKVNDL